MRKGEKRGKGGEVSAALESERSDFENVITSIESSMMRGISADASCESL